MAPCEYPKIATCSPAGTSPNCSLRPSTPLCTDTFHLAPWSPPHPGSGIGQNCASYSTPDDGTAIRRATVTAGDQVVVDGVLQVVLYLSGVLRTCARDDDRAHRGQPKGRGNGRRERLRHAEDQGGERRHDRDECRLGYRSGCDSHSQRSLAVVPSASCHRGGVRKALSGKLTSAPIHEASGLRSQVLS